MLPLKLDSSNMHSSDTAPEELENNPFREEVVKEDRSADDVLYEVMSKYRLDLSYPIEKVTLDQKKCTAKAQGS